MAGRTHVDIIADIGAVTPELSAYVLTSVSGTATLTGFFLDNTGVQVGTLATYSITTATTVTSLYNTANSLPGTTPLPSNLIGFEGALTGAAVYYGKSGNADGTYGQAPASGYPQIAVTTNFTLGRTSPQP